MGLRSAIDGPVFRFGGFVPPIFCSGTGFSSMAASSGSNAAAAAFSRRLFAISLRCSDVSGWRSAMVPGASGAAC